MFAVCEGCRELASEIGRVSERTRFKTSFRFICALSCGFRSIARFLIFSDNLALVLALCKGRSKILTLLSVMRRIFASGFRAGFVLSFGRIPSELNYSDKGSRFFHRDYDPSKSILGVFAQRFSRSSLAPTFDHDCLSPSLMYLEVGEVDFASHVHVPAVIVHSSAPSDDLSDCAGHTAAVSSQGSSTRGGMIAPEVVGSCRFVPVKRSVGHPLASLGRRFDGRQLGRLDPRFSGYGSPPLTKSH